MDFAGKTIVITGAGSGLGRSLALQLGQRGATVACVDYDASLLGETTALLEQQSLPCSGHLADIADRQAVAGLVADVDSIHGGFDGLVNNAGIMQSMTDVSLLSIEDIDRIMQVNFWGMVMLVKTSLPILERRQSALILNIASIGALSPFPGQTAYSASKAALRIFSEGLRMELLGSNVDVAVAMPGAMRTGIVENSPFHSDEAKKRLQATSGVSGLVLSPDRAARKILSAIGRGRRRIMVGADAWVLDKCYRIAPVTTSRLLHQATRSMRERLPT